MRWFRRSNNWNKLLEDAKDAEKKLEVAKQKWCENLISHEKEMLQCVQIRNTSSIVTK